jgi:hypothetical protein
MHPSYYYFGAPDSDSANDSYDPTRECFHIDGDIASDSKAEAAIGGRNITPPHVELPSTRDEANSLVQPKEHNLSRFKNCKPSSTRNERTCAYFSRPSSGSARRTHVMEELERELATLIIALLRIGRANP